MKNRSSLMLIEQLIMALVFMIAAAICLRVFAYSDALSASKEQRDTAVRQAQNAAEILKNTHGDTDAALSGSDTDGLSVELLSTDDPMLGSAEVRVIYGEGEQYSLRVCWQEDGP